ncbi:MAG: DNA polymerase IV [Betaproteobacteria bacterium]
MTARSPRLIAHLDMDAFYASVELLKYPELRGKPVVIGGGRRHQPEVSLDTATGATQRTFATLRGYVGRGVATTATYEARALGLHSAQGLMKAAAIAPDAILLPMDFDAYRRYSRLFKSAVATIAPHIEDRGIDEIYIDLTDVSLPGARIPAAAIETGFDLDSDIVDAITASERETETEVDAWWRARDVAKALKSAVRDATGLSCSIAVAPNKLLAKIASELDKPDGLTLLRPEDLATRIWPLPAKRINGIGPKAALKLEELGIRTIGELAQAEPAWLLEHFGRNYGAWLHMAAHGRDDREVVTLSEPRSISRETTFERDLSATRDRDELSAVFTDLCTNLAADLVRKRYAGRTIGIKLRFDNFTTVTRDQTIGLPTQDAATIRRAAGECLKRVPLERRIRLLGVRMATLTPAVPPLNTG